MVDVDNVLLLRPAEVGPAFEVDPARRPPVGAPERDAALTAVIGPAEADLEVIESALGESVLAHFVTEHARNDFPALPVREDVDVVVWLAAGEYELPAGVESTTASADPAFAASLRRAALAVSGRAGQPAEQIDERLEFVGREALLEDLDNLPDVGPARRFEPLASLVG